MNVYELDLRILMDHYQVVVTRDRGGKAMALCPFPSHKEKTPSFSIDYSKKVFNCFGCGQGGGAVRFVELMEECSREDAYTVLQEIFGVVLERGAKRAVPPTVAMEARRQHEFLKSLSGHYAWLNAVMPYVSYEEIEEDLYRRYFAEIRFRKEREQNPGPYLYSMLEGEIETLLVMVKEAWRNSWPPVMSQLREAHIVQDEELYFTLWNDDVDRVVVERDLLKEVERLTMKKFDRAGELMKSGNVKKLEKGKGILTAWIGGLRRMAAVGVYVNRNFILRESLA